MKIEKKLAWRNQKCNDCGDPVFKKQGEKSKVYSCRPNYTTALKNWILCEKCFKKIFKEPIK